MQKWETLSKTQQKQKVGFNINVWYLEVEKIWSNLYLYI
jgi:hypothetical protein